MMRGEWQMSRSIDKIADLVDRETFSLKFFYQIYKPSLFIYILRLIVEMFVMLLYNLDLPKLYNDIKIQLRFIS